MSRDQELAARGYCACELELPGGDRFACDLADGHELGTLGPTMLEHRARSTIVNAQGFRLPIELRWSATAYRPTEYLPR